MNVCMSSRRAVFALAASLIVLFGCKKAAVESYRVPKEPVAATASDSPAPAPKAGPSAASAPSGGSMANTPVATATGSDLAWTAPAGWTAKAPGSMRKGSYAVKSEGTSGEADLSITAFPGDVGGELANLNRWRGQVDLPPITQAQFESSVQRMERNGLKITVVELVGSGADAKRILGAMVPYAGATWFFKLMGPDAVVAKQKTAFSAFVETIKPAAK
jgi:hypothetical protein